MLLIEILEIRDIDLRAFLELVTGCGIPDSDRKLVEASNDVVDILHATL